MRKVMFYSSNIQWESVPQSGFRSITPGFCRGAVAALLVFDLTKRDSWEGIASYWYVYSVMI